jgi:hypothetical protein
VMALLVSIVAAIVVGGLATPRRHVAARAIELEAPPERVFALIHDVAAYPDWRDDLRSVQVDATDGAALQWTEVGQSGSVSYRAVTDDAPARVTARITNDDLSYSGEWQYALTPQGSGTRLVIAEHGDVGNPVFRFFGTHFIGFTRSIDAYLANLAMALHERAKPMAAAPADLAPDNRRVSPLRTGRDA